MNLYIMMRKMLRRDSTSRRCCSSSSQSRRDAVAYSTMMAVVLLFLLPLPSNSFQSPKIAARNLLRDVKGQDTIIKTVPNVEVTVANPFVMANNNEKSEQKSEEMRLELTDGTDEGRNADEDQLELIAPDGGDDNDGDNKEAIVRRNKAMASLLLLSAGSRRSTARDTNSMGARRRVGSSASKGRGGIPNKTSHLFTAVRRAANAAAKSIIDDSANNATKISQIAIDIDTTSIESSFLERNAGMDYTKQMVSPTTQMGVLGAAAAADEATMATSHPLLRKPQPGTLLIQPKKVERSNSIMSKESLIVRVATHFYDMDIASLRLSVFSDFSPAMRQQFSSRARQVLSNRRRRGAMCLVATIPAKSRRKDGRTDIVLGSIECSVHEFYGTLLGRRRKENSVLYITEVAVNPLYRRCGIGTKLLEVSQKTPMFCFQKLLLFKARLTLIVILKRESMNWLPNTAIMLNHCICMLM